MGDPHNEGVYEVKGDSSVSLGCGHSHCHVGEVTSEPLEPPRSLEFIGDLYPSCVNKSCGLHVHVSVDNQLSYSRLMDKRF